MHEEVKELSNVELEYLYRDASNYKFWNSIIFANPTAISLENAEERIRRSLDDQEVFIAHQIYVPDIFPFPKGKLTEDDHCYHEFVSVRFTKEAPNDTRGRSIAEFIEEIERVAQHGWDVFDPHDMVQ